MELIKSAGQRTRLSEAVYILLNILLPVILLVTVRSFDTAWIAITLLVLSKWRVLAVRPRYWFINVKSNLIDFLVGISFAFLLLSANDSLPTQIILTVMYMVWLVYIKPKSRRHFMAIQAGLGLFITLTAVMSYSPYLDVTIVTILAWLAGYATARHAVSAYEEEHLESIALVFGLLMAELSWLAFHWTLSYPLFGGIAVPQLALIAAVLAFGAYNLYDNFYHANPNRLRMRLTVVVSISLLAIILFFARWNVTI
jgi:hypothetical protein